MNKKIFIFLMITIIFTNLEAKDLESLFDNYSEAISRKIEDKVNSVNDTIVNEIDNFGRNFITPYEENDNEKNKYQEEDDDDDKDYKKYYRRNENKDDDEEEEDD